MSFKPFKLDEHTTAVGGKYFLSLKSKFLKNVCPYLSVCKGEGNLLRLPPADFPSIEKVQLYLKTSICLVI